MDRTPPHLKGKVPVPSHYDYNGEDFQNFTQKEKKYVNPFKVNQLYPRHTNQPSLFNQGNIKGQEESLYHQPVTGFRTHIKVEQQPFQHQYEQSSKTEDNRSQKYQKNYFEPIGKPSVMAFNLNPPNKPKYQMNDLFDQQFIGSPFDDPQENYCKLKAPLIDPFVDEQAENEYQEMMHRITKIRANKNGKQNKLYNDEKRYPERKIDFSRHNIQQENQIQRSSWGNKWL